MPKYAQIDLETKKVIGVSDLREIENYPHLIAITDEFYNNPNAFDCYYEYGKFVGYHIDVTYDALNQKVRATVYDHLNQLMTTYANSIIFEYEGQQIIVSPVSGVAEIDFVSEVPGDHVVRTVNNKVRNGQVIIHVG